MTRCKFNRDIVCTWGECTPKCKHFQRMGQTMLGMFNGKQVQQQQQTQPQPVKQPEKEKRKVISTKEKSGITTTFYKVEK